MTDEKTTFRKKIGMNGKKWWVGGLTFFAVQYVALMVWLVSGQMRDNVYFSEGARFTPRTQKQLDEIQNLQLQMLKDVAVVQSELRSYSAALENHLKNHP